jgi:hypothetical protein
VFGEKGAGFFFQGTRTQGKLFLTAFGLDREHTSWPVHQSFIPFLDLALQTARAEDPTPTNYEPGEVAVVQVSPPLTAKTLVLRDTQLAAPQSDEGGHELSRATVEQGRAQLRLPDQPGLYSVSYDDNPAPQKVFSVNPSPKESQLVYSTSPEAVKVWQLAHSDTARIKAAATRAQISLSGILQQRVWWWMLVGGLAALLFEIALTELKKAK